MGDARALLASIGTSALLISAVAVSLLTLSVVFAIGGFQGAEAAGSREALILDLQDRARSERVKEVARTATPIVARAPARSPRSRRPTRSSSPSGRVRSEPAATTSSAIKGNPQVAQLGAGGASGGEGSAPPNPSSAAGKPNVGDSVQKLGDDLSSTLQQTGANLAQATAPLGPPVSAAVQQIVNFVAALVQQTTNALGGVLGATPDP